MEHFILGGKQTKQFIIHYVVLCYVCLLVLQIMTDLVNGPNQKGRCQLGHLLQQSHNVFVNIFIMERRHQAKGSQWCDLEATTNPRGESVQLIWLFHVMSLVSLIYQNCSVLYLIFHLSLFYNVPSYLTDSKFWCKMIHGLVRWQPCWNLNNCNMCFSFCTNISETI